MNLPIFNYWNSSFKIKHKYINIKKIILEFINLYIVIAMKILIMLYKFKQISILFEVWTVVNRDVQC